jgi:hypothetical protein
METAAGFASTDMTKRADVMEIPRFRHICVSLYCLISAYRFSYCALSCSPQKTFPIMMMMLMNIIVSYWHDAHCSELPAEPHTHPPNFETE